jgi:hypothetical protein
MAGTGRLTAPRKSIREPTVTTLSSLCAVLVASSAGLGAAGDDITPQVVSGKIQWVYGYAQGKALGRNTGKPLFVVFRCER